LRPRGFSDFGAYAPDLHAVVDQLRAAGCAFVCLDGALIEASRCSTKSTAGQDLWYSGKHHAHGGNILVLTEAGGFPVWTSPVDQASQPAERLDEERQQLAERPKQAEQAMAYCRAARRCSARSR
jgi:hypothetical protein